MNREARWTAVGTCGASIGASGRPRSRERREMGREVSRPEQSCVSWSDWSWYLLAVCGWAGTNG